MTLVTDTEREGALASASGAARREVLVDLAIGIVAEGGLSSLTYRSLAKAAGCSTAPVVGEFPSRELLLEAVFERAWGRAGIREGEAESSNPLQTLRDVCTRAVPVSPEPDPAIRTYFELFFETTRNAELKGFISRIETEGQPGYLRLVERAQSSGQIDSRLDPEDVLDAIWSLGDGLCLAAYAYPEQFTPERTRKVWESGFEAIVSARPT